MSAPAPRARVSAVLGPTNTGKTHFALERMLGHRSGIIGFPLRLLARENYDRVVRAKGARAAALVTGEERIIPRGARYFLCTVEAMPRDIDVEFLAIDEVQLAADRDRGHVFTDRLLHARGALETQFLGAETARPVIRRLVPGVEFLSRPRFSRLSHAGARRLTRLPPRSAVVAFSAADVYALAEQIRRRQGGVAVVLGALSPRTRNAQVGMFEDGDVDYVVATDAIGMGLNLNIGHVAFAGLSKFDGHAWRALDAHELGQIAGRAGRYLRDGTFGTTAGAGTIPDETVEIIEQHAYPALRGAYWRNTDLDFSSLDALRRSLDLAPPDPVLLRPPGAEDQVALQILGGRPDIAARADRPERVALLWEVCQVPDYRKILSDWHARLLARVYLGLTGGDGRLETDWVARQIAALDRTDGEIEALTQRISFIRTWTYVSHRADWFEDARHWQERTRAIEDRLSDALHERLTQRFVDRRAATLARGLSGGGPLAAAVTRDDEVVVEGEPVGRLSGFRFVSDGSARGDDARAIRAAARQALGEVMAARIARCESDPDSAFRLDDEGRICWRGAPVARLGRGADPLSPQVTTLASDLLGAPLADRVASRARAWLAAEVGRRLAPLVRLRDGMAALSGAPRGLAFQLLERLGTLDRRDVAGQVAALTRADRRALRGLGVVVGMRSVHVAALARGRGRPMRRHLAAAQGHEAADPGARLAVPRNGDAAGLLAQGFVPTGPVAIRADALERLAGEARRLARQGPFVATPALAAMAGLEDREIDEVLRALGYRRRQHDDGSATWTLAPPRRGRRRDGRDGKSVRAGGGRAPDPDSPFAELRRIRFAR